MGHILGHKLSNFQNSWICLSCVKRRKISHLFSQSLSLCFKLTTLSLPGDEQFQCLMIMSNHTFFRMPMQTGQKMLQYPVTREMKTVKMVLIGSLFIGYSLI